MNINIEPIEDEENSEEENDTAGRHPLFAAPIEGFRRLWNELSQ
jgi:hypothetical protein